VYIQVRVGGLWFDLGYVEYVGGDTTWPGRGRRAGWALGWWPVAVGGVAAVLVVAVGVLVAMFVRRSSYNDRLYGRLQAQLRALESNVRDECKLGILCSSLIFRLMLVAWHSGRTSVSGRRTFPVLRSTCS